MSQVSPRFISEKTLEKIFALLFESLQKIRDKKQLKQFIDIILTPTEKIMIAKRVSIIYLLVKGVDYRTISHLLKVSTTTVSKISLSFNQKDKNDSTRKLFDQIMRDEKMGRLIDKLGEVLFETFPPKYRNWKRWAQEKAKQKKYFKDPF